MNHTDPVSPVGSLDRDRRRPKVLLVGWDGVRYDTLREVDPPTVRTLAARGVFAETRVPDTSVAKSATAPGWSTILTGVWPDKHGVTRNGQRTSNLERYPDVMALLKQVDKRWRTFAALDAAMLGTTKGPGPIVGPDGVETLFFHNRHTTPGSFAACDPLVLEDAIPHLTNRDPDFSFVYFGVTDQMAHDHGVGVEYREAIVLQDTRLRLLLDAVAARPTYAEEDWLVIVTTDHGHRDEGGHGGDLWQERQSFVLAAGGGVHPRDAITNVDIVPTVLTHLGVPINPAWELDGTPLNAAPGAGNVLTQRVAPTSMEPTTAG